MHPLVLILVAMLVALGLASIAVFHRRAALALRGQESLAVDSDAMLIAWMADARGSR